MAENDFAVVVGIGSYALLDPLKGPEADAKAFKDWLVDSRGGQVPEAQIQMIFSSDPAVAAAAPGKPHPTVIEVQSALENIQNIADANMKAGKGRRVGRRLYLYLAGHGFSPVAEQTGLLMANAAPSRAGATYHILGQYNAGWFYRAGYFDEICLFMDCCREVYTATSLNFTWPDEVDPTAVDRCRFFYGFGTKWSQTSRERAMPPDDQVRGVFTTALLAGLRGAAVEPGDASGRITAESLEAYLIGYMKEFLSPDDRASPDVPKEPDIDFKPRVPARQFVITQMPPERGVAQRVINFVRRSDGEEAKFSVTITVDPARRGKAAQIILGIDGTTVAETSRALGAEWTVRLGRGTYIARVAGEADAIFEVSGLQEVTRVNV